MRIRAELGGSGARRLGVDVGDGAPSPSARNLRAISLPMPLHGQAFQREQSVAEQTSYQMRAAG
jgi:hypothetical protein